MSDAPPDLLAHALDYAAMGWCIIPIRNAPNGSKAPAGSWKSFQSKRPSDATLRAGFAKSGLTGLAIIVGDVSGGVYVRDFDKPESYNHWREAHPNLAASLPTVRSGRGFHVYGRWPGVAFCDLGDGELCAGSNHYVLLPPSMHPSGKRYEWFIAPNGDVPTIDPVVAGLARPWCETPHDGADGVYKSGSTNKADPPAYESGSTNFQTLPSQSPDTRAVAADTRAGSPDTRNSPPSPSSLPVSSCVSALVSADDRRVVEAIVATLPGEPGRRHRRLFAFLRRLRAMPELADATESVIRPLVEEWHRRALPTISTKDWEETWADAVRGWPRVRSPHGHDFAQALARAKAAPDPACALCYGREDVRLLVRLCRELAALHAPKPFPLPCRIAGEAVGINRTKAADFLAMLTADGVIERVKRGHPGRASEYRWKGGYGEHPQ